MLRQNRKNRDRSMKPSGGSFQRRLLPFLLCLLFMIPLAGCGRKKLEHSYDIRMGLTRMNAVSVSDVSGKHADGFSKGLALPDAKQAVVADGLTAEAALLVSNEGDDPQVLVSKNPYVRTYPASITKVMTALVCLRHVDDLQQEFTVTQNSKITVSGSSMAYIHPGETLTIEELLYGMLLPSGNDAAVAVAEATAGSVDAFVEMMNETAMEIGATGCHFVNVNGLPDENHYMTPYDIYLTLHAALAYDAFREIVGSVHYDPEYKDANGMPKKQEWTVSNKYMLGEVETPDGLRVLGGKTGTTKAAGYCLTQATEKEATGEEFISTVMKAKTRDDLYANMTMLLEKIH